MKIPTKEECIKLLHENEVPSNVVSHLNAVCDFSMKVCDIVEKRGIAVNRKLIAAAALLHDVYKIKSQKHELDGADYVSFLGYIEVGNLIRKHGLVNLHKKEFQPSTWEEKIVFYSDKRCQGDKVVTVDQRFEGIKQRYKREIIGPELEFTKKVEKELLQGEKL